MKKARQKVKEDSQLNEDSDLNMNLEEEDNMDNADVILRTTTSKCILDSSCTRHMVRGDFVEYITAQHEVPPCQV